MKGWQLKRIDELGKIITGKTPSSNNPDEFGFEYPFITPTDMHSGKKVIVERF
jgi:type I restriction enzyme S subunit